MSTNIIYTEFVSLLGIPQSKYLLNEYISYCYYYNKLTDDMYCEVHHILPRSKFENNIYFNNSLNLIKLRYEDHITAHTMLSDAYSTVSSFKIPLNFMTENKYLNSDRAVDNWTEFKKSKQYDVWRAKRSNYMKERWQNIKYREYMCKMSHNLFKDEHHRQKHSEGIKNFWKNNKKAKEQLSKRIKQNWHCEEYRTKYSNTMKKLYENDDFRQKRIQTNLKIGLSTNLEFEKKRIQTRKNNMVKNKYRFILIDKSDNIYLFYLVRHIRDFLVKHKLSFTLLKRHINTRIQPHMIKDKSHNKQFSINTIGYKLYETN